MKNPFRRANGAVEFRSHSEVTPIVRDAAVASQTCGDGRLIPLLIVDTTARPDIDELVRVHQYSAPGDVRLCWAGSPNDKYVYLMAKFARPLELEIVLAFDPEPQRGLIDLILKARSMFLQPGEPGDTLATTFHCPRILIEVPDLKFEPVWEKIRQKLLVKRLRAEGLNRNEAKVAAAKVSQEWDKLCDYRMNKPNSAQLKDEGAILRRQILGSFEDDRIIAAWKEADDENAIIVVADIRDKLGKDIGNAVLGEEVAGRLSATAVSSSTDIPTIMTTVPRTTAAAGLSDINPKISRALTKTAVPNTIQILIIAGGGTSLVHMAKDG